LIESINTENQDEVKKFKSCTREHFQGMWPSSVASLCNATLTIFVCSIGLQLIGSGTRSILWNKKEPRVFLLVRTLFVNDMLKSMDTFIYQGWHMRNFLFSAPEVLSLRACFSRTSLQIYFMTLYQLLDMLIAIDRLISVLAPMKYLTFHSKRYYVLISIACGFCASCCLSGHFDTFSDAVTLLYCSSRNSFGRIWQYLVYAIMFVFDSTTVLVYTTMIIVVRLKINHTQPFWPEGSVEKKQNEMMKKLTKVSMSSCLCYLIVGPTNVFVTLILKAYFPQVNLSFGQYIGILFYTNTTIFFINSCIFLSDFRRGVLKMFGFKVSEE